MNSSLKARASRIKVVIFDVDGVLTDGRLIYGDRQEFKIFHVRDGQGIVLARQAGLKIAFVTARSGKAVRRRAKELGVDLLFEGAADKASTVRSIAERCGAAMSEICYVGDDLVDLPAMRLVGLAVGVCDAVPEVREAAHWVTGAAGGRGAAREVLEGILKSQKKWRAAVRKMERGA